MTVMEMQHTENLCDSLAIAIRELGEGPRTTAEEKAAMQRRALDLKDRLAELDKSLSTIVADIDRDLLALSEETGLDALRAGGMSYTFSDALRFGYEPDKWEQIVRWAVETNNLHVVQRRLTDSRLQSLMDEGVQLPDGIKLEGYRKVNRRRI